MISLALTLEPSPLEMPVPFASRLAQRNLCNSLSEFARDVDLDIQGLETGDEVAIEHLRQLACLPSNAFRNTLTSEQTKKSVRVGHEFYRSNTFTRHDVRICPDCISDDIKKGGSVAHAVHRLHWQISHIATCHVHNRPLVSVSRAQFASRNFDTCRVIANHLQTQQNTGSITCQEATNLEQYLSLRAYGHQSPCWADNLEIFGLLKAAIALGVFIERGPNAQTTHLTRQTSRVPADLGFQIRRGGPIAMRQSWEEFRTSDAFRDGKGRYQPHPRFGAFQRLLASDLKYREEFNPIRQVFRDYLIETFPFPDGADVLGKPLPKRKLHSLISATRAIGKRASTFHDRLVTEGIAKRIHGGHLELCGPLTVADVDQYKKEIDGLIFERDAAVFSGITVESFRILAEADLVPCSQITDKWRHKAFAIHELEKWRAKLLVGLPRIQTVARDQAVITKAPVRLNCDLCALVDAITNGKLKPAGLWRSKQRLDCIVIDIAAAKAALPPLPPPAGMQRIPTFRLLRFNNTTLNHLVEKDLLRSFRARHPTTRLMAEFICTTSIKCFNEQYVSLGILANHDGLVGGPQLARLRNAGMHPAISGPGLSNIYRRCDLNSDYADVGLDLAL